MNLVRITQGLIFFFGQLSIASACNAIYMFEGACVDAIRGFILVHDILTLIYKFLGWHAARGTFVRFLLFTYSLFRICILDLSVHFTFMTLKRLYLEKGQYFKRYIWRYIYVSLNKKRLSLVAYVVAEADNGLRILDHPKYCVARGDASN